MAEQNSINNSSSILDVDNLRLDGNTISSTDTNGNIVLSPDGSGSVSVTTAPIVPTGDRSDSLGSATNSWDNVYCDGLTFNDGTDVMSSYVGFSSYVPSLEFGGATTGITYTLRNGGYIRIGDLIFFSLYIELSSKGTATGNARVNLPVNADITTVSQYTVSLEADNLGFAGGTSLSGLIASTGYVGIRSSETGAGSHNLTNTEFANNTVLRISGCYGAA